MTQKLMMFDGSSNVKIDITGQTFLTAEAELALDWAIKKQKEEESISQLAIKYPAVAEAIAELDVLIKLHENI